MKLKTVKLLTYNMKLKIVKFLRYNMKLIIVKFLMYNMKLKIFKYMSALTIALYGDNDQLVCSLVGIFLLVFVYSISASIFIVLISWAVT